MSKISVDMEKVNYRPVDHDEVLSSSGSEDDAMLGGSRLKVVRQNSRLRRTWQVLGAVLFLSIYTALVATVARKTSGDDQAHDGRITKSPASEYIKYEVREIDYLNWQDSSDYFGEPGPEVDSNWHELVRYHNIGLPESFMQQLGRVDQGVKFPDGRYFGSMMVYHHLHCLKHIYHTLHPEHYGIANKTGVEAEAWTKHTEHCLGALKAYVMCQADTTIETMKWDYAKVLPLHNVTSTHRCVNWNSVLDYAMDNNVDIFADGVLVHPVFGPVFKDRKQILGNS